MGKEKLFSTKVIIGLTKHVSKHLLLTDLRIAAITILLV